MKKKSVRSFVLVVVCVCVGLVAWYGTCTVDADDEKVSIDDLFLWKYLRQPAVDVILMVCFYCTEIRTVLDYSTRILSQLYCRSVVYVE